MSLRLVKTSALSIFCIVQIPIPIVASAVIHTAGLVLLLKRALGRERWIRSNMVLIYSTQWDRTDDSRYMRESWSGWSHVLRHAWVHRIVHVARLMKGATDQSSS